MQSAKNDNNLTANQYIIFIEQKDRSATYAWNTCRNSLKYTIIKYKSNTV